MENRIVRVHTMMSKWSSIQLTIFDRDKRQFERQARVAKKCELKYLIAMKEALGYAGYLSVLPEFAPYLVNIP
jgi:hypothetical protein